MVVRVRKCNYYPYPMEVEYAKARLENPLFFVAGGIAMVVDYPSSTMTEDKIDTIIIVEEKDPPLWRQAMDLQMMRKPQKIVHESCYQPDRFRRKYLTDHYRVEVYQVIS